MNKQMNEEQVCDFQALPTPESCRVIDFESAQVVTLPTQPPQHILIVSGRKAYFNMEVSLSPLLYIKQPEYWGIEVVGCLPQVGLPVVTPLRLIQDSVIDLVLSCNDQPSIKIAE